jgi:L-ascorbate metabolism protein UlaG (beta-lactamase superfamily)
MSGTTITWLGHSAFRIDAPSGMRTYVDPFLQGNPSCPEVEYEPQRCDLIAVTHGHSDHVGNTVALQQRFGCPVVAQVELRRWLTEQGATDDGMSHSINKGGSVTIGDVSLTLTHANHSSSSHEGRYLGESCGFIMRIADSVTIYIAGDTNVMSDMELIGRIYAPDVAVLPIGDHFTMGPREAAVAAGLVGAPVVIPCHWGTFPRLTGTPEALIPLLPAGIELRSPQPGEELSL